MVVFYESFSTIYLLIAEVREDKREEASDDVLLENGDQKTSAVYEQTFVTKNFFLLICIFVSGALVWYSYELVHYVLLTSDYICYLVEPLHCNDRRALCLLLQHHDVVLRGEHAPYGNIHCSAWHLAAPAPRFLRCP